MICLQNTRSFRNPLHRKKSGTVNSGDRAGQAMSPKLEITVLNIVARSNAPLRLTIWNGVLSSTVPLSANHDKLSRRRNIQIWNLSVSSAPPGMMNEVPFVWFWILQYVCYNLCSFVFVTVLSFVVFFICVISVHVFGAMHDVLVWGTLGCTVWLETGLL